MTLIRIDTGAFDNYHRGPKAGPSVVVLPRCRRSLVGCSRAEADTGFLQMR